MPERSMSTHLLQGTLDLLILKSLSIAPMHGWGIAQRIRQVSGEVFAVNQGSLYPALARLEHKGLSAASMARPRTDARSKPTPSRPRESGN
jgi:PadR family transcriptional regulator, regulatory protein PadR